MAGASALQPDVLLTVDDTWTHVWAALFHGLDATQTGRALSTRTPPRASARCRAPGTSRARSALAHGARGARRRWDLNRLDSETSRLGLRAWQLMWPQICIHWRYRCAPSGNPPSYGLSLAALRVGSEPPDGGTPRDPARRFDDDPWGLRMSNLLLAPNQWGTRRVKGVSRRFESITISLTRTASPRLPGPSDHPCSVANRALRARKNLRRPDTIALRWQGKEVGARTSSTMGIGDVFGRRASTSKISIRTNWGCTQ
jgi:hypothetical protein